jgi:hypothetical protein
VGLLTLIMVVAWPWARRLPCLHTRLNIYHHELS